MNTVARFLLRIDRCPTSGVLSATEALLHSSGYTSLARVEDLSQNSASNGEFVDVRRMDVASFFSSVAPELEDRGKASGLACRVLRLFSVDKASSALPKGRIVVTNGDENVYRFTVPRLTWGESRTPSPERGKKRARNSQCFPQNSSSSKSSSVGGSSGEHEVDVSGYSLKDASANFIRLMLQRWSIAGLLEPGERSLSISKHPSPVIIRSAGLYGDGGRYRSYVDDEELRDLTTKSWSGETHLISNSDAAAQAVRDILDHAAKRRKSNPLDAVLGFDIEFKPIFSATQPKSPPALIQVATEQSVYLFHLKRFVPGFRAGCRPEIVAKALKPLIPLLESSRVLKCGVGVTGDFDLIKSYLPRLSPRGVVELQSVAEQAGFKRAGLRPLSYCMLGICISKSQQRSNWDKQQLSEAQIKYAATDAWVSREVAVKLAPLWLKAFKDK